MIPSHSIQRFLAGPLLFFLTMVCALAQTANEEVLFFDGRADQTATENGGAVIFPLESKHWRFWFENVYHARVSPDGKKVAYRFENSINVADIDGQNPKTLAFDLPGSPFSWSPNSDRIAFFNHWLLTVIDLEGNVLLSKNAGYFNFYPPTWSPDGSKLAYSVMWIDRSRQRTIACMDVITGEESLLYEPEYVRNSSSDLFEEHVEYPVWSPDGNSLAVIRSVFQRDGPTRRWYTSNVAIMPAHGGKPRELTSLPEYGELSSLPKWLVALDWSPDGKHIAYAVNPFEHDPSPIEAGIYRVSVSGGVPEKINGFVPHHFGYHWAVGYSSTSLQWAILNPTQLKTHITYVDREAAGPVALGEEVRVRLVVESDEQELTANAVAFTDAAGLQIPNQFEIVEEPESTDIGTLGPGEKVAFEWILRAVVPGDFSFTHHEITGQLEDGADIDAFAAKLNGSVSGMTVTIVLPEGPLELERRDEGASEDDPSAYTPLEFEAIIQVTVPEEGIPLENVTFQGFDASDGGLDIDLVLATGVEETPWQDVHPQPVPAPVWVSTPAAEGIWPEVLQPGGDPASFTVTITATRPGQFELAALFTAAPEGDGATLTARGTEIADLKGDVVLSMELEVVNAPPRITEGESVEISGMVENVSLTETLELDPLIVISSGQGVPRGPVQIDEALPLAGTPGIFAPILEPGEREFFRLRVDTLSLPGFDQRYMGRQSVVIDFAASGKVINSEGEERDLEPSAVVVEWGNGRHDVEGATFLRAEVTPDLKASRLLSPDDFYTIAAGDALENLVLGGWDMISGIPGMIGSLPSTLWGLAEVSGQAHTEGQTAVYNAGRYLWAWTDMQLAIWTHIDAANREEQLQSITEELTQYYGDRFDSTAQVRQIVDGAITEFFGKIDSYQRRAYEASNFGFNEELAAVAAEPFRPIGALALEELAATAAIAGWLSKVSRSSEIAGQVTRREELFRAKGAEEATEATQSMSRLGDPRITEMPDPMRALPASTPLDAKHAIDGWGVDPVSDKNLIRMTDAKTGGMPIFAAIRSRADETIEWMKTQLGIVPKPMTFKPKNVDADDVKYLGYRGGVGYGDANGIGAGDRGATLLAEPIPREIVIERLQGVDEVTRTRVLGRHADRWEEWYGHTDFNSRVIDQKESKFWKLSNKMTTRVSDTGRTIKSGTLDVPRRGSVPQPGINADTVGPGVLDARQFELRQVTDPPDNGLFENGRQYFECWLEDDLGAGSSRGVMRRIAGDIDMVAVGMADGSALPVASEFSETVAKNMLHGVQAQHPWSSSLVVDDLFQKFVNNGTHRWHPDPAKRGEPLLIYVNGERRVGWFHPTRTITRENPLKGFMWLDGGMADVDDVIRFQKDMRGTLESVSEVHAAMAKPISSTIRELFLKQDLDAGTELVATCAINTGRTGGSLFRLSQSDVFEKRNEDGTWEPANPSDGCEEGGVVIMPETFLSEGIPEGAAALSILEDLLGFDWEEMFQIGDHIIINPGSANEEHRRITGHGSLVLDRPLSFTHPAGTRIVSLGNTNNDTDADGLTDAQEQELGTRADLPDTDADGVDDGTEVRQGTNPLVADSFPPSRPELRIRKLPDGRLEIVTPESATNISLESSLSLEPDTWTPFLNFEQPEAEQHRYLIPLEGQERFFRLRTE